MRERIAHVAGKGLDRGGVAKIESVNAQPLAPVREVRLTGVARRAVTRKTRGDHNPTAVAQQQDGRVITDLDPRARDDRHATAQIMCRRTLPEI